MAWRHPIKDQTSQALKFSGLMRRLAALIYDSFLLFGITFAGYGTLLLLLKIIFHGVDNLEDVQPGPALQWLFAFGWFASMLSYYYISWRKQGQTMGMKAWRLRLQQHDGTLASPKQCIVRGISAPLSMLCLGLGYLWILLPNSKGCFHDLITDTEVVVVKK